VLESLATWLVAGSALLGLALIMFMFFYRGARLSGDAWWVSEFAVGSIFVPIIVTLTAFGIGALGVAWAGRADAPITLAQAGDALIIAAVSAVIAMLLRRGAGGLFDRLRPPAEVVQLPPAIPAAPELDRAA